jgi:hypothetical protein
MKMFTPNVKNLLALTLLATLTTASAKAGWFGKKDAKSEPNQAQSEQTETLNNVINLPIPQDQEAMQRRALQVLGETMVPQLNEIQRLLNEDQSEAALTLAKSVLDDVRVKTGIDPKAKLRENFLVSTTFPAGAVGMNSLTPAQQQMVIYTVKSFRGGLYLDILNLTKRTTLLYVKALHQQMAKQGGVNDEDRAKILRDLALATIVPMPIQDKAGKIINVFDEEVANEDHTYMFNRELKMYLLASPDLRITEKSFIEYRERLKVHYAPKSPSSTPQEHEGASCMRQAYQISDYSVRLNAQVTCFNKHYESSETGAACMALARDINSWSLNLKGSLEKYEEQLTKAQKACFDYFNK